MSIQEQITKHNIKSFTTEEGITNLRYDYQDKGYNFCSITISTKEVTQSTINKLLKNK